MFDFSFAELVVIGVVALIVIGPERMPKVARAAGLLFGRAQRYVSEVKADINNQLKLEELRKIEADMRAKRFECRAFDHRGNPARRAGIQGRGGTGRAGCYPARAWRRKSPMSRDLHPQKIPQSHRRSSSWVWIRPGPTQLRLHHPSDHA